MESFCFIDEEKQAFILLWIFKFIEIHNEIHNFINYKIEVVKDNIKCAQMLAKRQQ